jgi:hypothetical protein
VQATTRWLMRFWPSWRWGTSPLSVQDAVAAARMVHEHVLANDLEYEQWVASL